MNTHQATHTPVQPATRSNLLTFCRQMRRQMKSAGARNWQYDDFFYLRQAQRCLAGLRIARAAGGAS